MANSDFNGIRAAHIAVVDDDASVRQALRRLLNSLGCAVTTFASADDLLRSQTLEQQNCLILDIQMPGLSGLDLQKIVTSLRASVPIIFITAHPDEDVRQQAMQNGAVGFLEKPFDDEALIQLIQQAILHPAT